jgi:hypothetical protein
MEPSQPSLLSTVLMVYNSTAITIAMKSHLIVARMLFNHLSLPLNLESTRENIQVHRLIVLLSNIDNTYTYYYLIFFFYYHFSSLQYKFF